MSVTSSSVSGPSGLAPEPTIRQQIKPLGTAIFLIFLVGVALSLSVALLAIEMERMRVDSFTAGLNTAALGVGKIAIVFFIPRLAAAFGVRPILFLATAGLAASILAFKAIPQIEAWFVFRLIFGASLGAMFTLSEFWINASAPPSKRGVVMGAYATALGLGFTLGPAIIALVGSEGWAPYSVAAAIMALGFAPLLASGSSTPSVEGDHSSNVLAFVIAAPVATMAGLVFGAMETASVSTLPVLGLRSGYPEATAALLVSIFAAGNIISQVPIGLLADRMDKVRLLLAIALVSLGFVSTIPFVLDRSWLLAAAIFCFGGIVGSLYTVGLAHLGASFSGMQLANANAAFVILYSAGLAIGPPVVGAGMTAFDTAGFSVAVGALLALYALVAAMGVWRGRGPRP
jgi:MFS family permease